MTVFSNITNVIKTFHLMNTAYTNQLQLKKTEITNCKIKEVKEINIKLKIYCCNIKQVYNKANKAVLMITKNNLNNDIKKNIYIKNIYIKKKIKLSFYYSFYLHISTSIHLNNSLTVNTTCCLHSKI